jgi:hypothetical protein
MLLEFILIVWVILKIKVHCFMLFTVYNKFCIIITCFLYTLLITLLVTPYHIPTLINVIFTLLPSNASYDIFLIAIVFFNIFLHTFEIRG